MSTEALQSQIVQKAWQDPSFKSKLLSNPKEALQQFLDISLPDNIKIQTLEENENEFYIVLPPSPAKAIMADVTPQAVWGD